MLVGQSIHTSKFFGCLQVRTYSKVFWKRYKELGEDQGEKYIKQIERGEQRIQRQQDIMDAIAAKMDRYRNPWQVRAKDGSLRACQWAYNELIAKSMDHDCAWQQLLGRAKNWKPICCCGPGSD